MANVNEKKEDWVLCLNIGDDEDYNQLVFLDRYKFGDYLRDVKHYCTVSTKESARRGQFGFGYTPLSTYDPNYNVKVKFVKQIEDTYYKYFK